MLTCLFAPSCTAFNAEVKPQDSLLARCVLTMWLFINAESLVLEVARGVLAQHGRALTPEALAAAAGRRPLEAWQATVDALGLTEVTAQQLYDESEALLKER